MVLELEEKKWRYANVPFFETEKRIDGLPLPDQCTSTSTSSNIASSSPSSGSGARTISSSSKTSSSVVDPASSSAAREAVLFLPLAALAILDEDADKAADRRARPGSGW